MDDIEADVAAFEAHLASEQPLVVQPEQPVAVVEQGPVNMLSAIMQIARDPSVDVSKVSAFLAMQERMEARESERLFGEALVRIQSKIPRVPKTGIVNLGKEKGSYDFGKWEDLDAAVSPFLQEEGMAVTFSEESSDANGIRWCAKWRAYGHTEMNFITLPADTGAGRNPLQARGSTNSYAKRYLAADFLKIVFIGADDDGKRGGTTYITQDKVDRLTKGIEATGTDPREILNLADEEIHTFSEVTDADFPKMMNALISIAREQKAFTQ